MFSASTDRPGQTPSLPMTARSFRLDGPHDTQVWLSEDARMPRMLYWGAGLPADEDLEALALALQAPIPQGGLDVAEVVSWLPEPGRGFTDGPGLELRRGSDSARSPNPPV